MTTKDIGAFADACYWVCWETEGDEDEKTFHAGNTPSRLSAKVSEQSRRNQEDVTRATVVEQHDRPEADEVEWDE